MTMPLSPLEAGSCSQAFLVSLYGSSLVRAWQKLKFELKFSSEREFMLWVIDVINMYKDQGHLPLPPQDDDVEELLDSSDAKHDNFPPPQAKPHSYLTAYSSSDLKPPLTPHLHTSMSVPVSGDGPPVFDDSDHIAPPADDVPWSEPYQPMVVDSVDDTLSTMPGTGNNDRPACRYCGKTFSHARHRSRHEKTVHLETEKESCPFCHQAFSRRDNLRVHVAKVHGQKTPPRNMSGNHENNTDPE